MTEGELLKNALKNKGIGPTEAARKMGYESRISIYNFYKVKEFEDETKQKFLKYLGIDIEDIKVRSKPGMPMLNEPSLNYNVKIKGSNVRLSSMERAISEVYNKHDPSEVKDFQVIGDCMGPHIPDGSILRAVQITPYNARSEGLHVIIYDGGRSQTFARITNDIDKNNSITAYCDNTAHSHTQRVHVDNIDEIYSVYYYLLRTQPKTSDIEHRVTSLESKIDKLLQRHEEGNL